MNWFVFAFLSAVFAALTTIFAKVGLKGIDSNLATAIRTIVVLVMEWIVVVITGAGKAIESLTKTNITFLVLSGLATGLSWLFYFRAVQIGEVSKVVPVDKFSLVLVLVFSVIALGEPLTWQVIVATILITAGTFVLLI